jgi:TOBE domain
VIGDVAVEAPAATLAALAIGDKVDIFLRPEHLTVIARGAPGALPGTIAAQVFQGGHVDRHIDMPGLARGRVLLRAPGMAALTAYPVGTEIGVGVSAADVVAFPPDGDS